MAITVTASTRLDDLQTLANASETNARLVGKRDNLGNIVLYQSQNADPSLWSRLAGRAAEKRALAREAVHQALANTFPSTLATDATLCSVRRLIDAGQSRELRAAELGRLAKFAATAPDAGQSWLAGAKLDQNKLSVLEAGFAAREEGGRHLPAVADHFSNYLAGEFRKSGADAQAFALSDGRAFKGDLLRHLNEAFETHKTHALKKLDAAGVDDFLSSVFYRTAAKVLDNGISGDTLTSGGEKYTRDAKPVGKGSEGVRVERFSGPNGKQVAVKFFPNLDKAEIAGGAYREEKERRAAQRMIQREVEAFSSAASGRHANVLGYGGVVRTPSGEVGIVMEYAPHGTVDTLARNLAEALEAGAVSPEAAMAVKIAILRDMVEGLAHLHGKPGLAHLDFKTLNCFVGEGGVCKVADFGNSIGTQKFDIAGEQLAAALMYVAPEAIDFHAAASRMRVERLLYDVSALSSKASSSDRTMARDAMHDVLAQRLGLRRDIDGAALDAWALGSSMFTTVFGRDIGQCDPKPSGPEGERVRAALQKLRATPDARVIDAGVGDSGPQGNAGRLAPGALAGSSGNVLVDDLINRLMHPDPKQRLSVDQARTHRLFQETPDIGNAVCRDLLVELGSANPDPARLQALSLKF